MVPLLIKHERNRQGANFGVVSFDLGESFACRRYGLEEEGGEEG